MNKLSVYELKCLTNMHVGDGEANYNIVDNEVQRDIVLNVPTIHSSGVKGALRSFATNNGMEKSQIDEIFGAEGENGKQGNYKFLSGNMLARPVRVSDGPGAYVLATSKAVITTQINLLKSLGIACGDWNVKLDPNKVYKSKALKDVKAVEGIKLQEEINIPVIDAFLGTNWVLFPDEKLANMSLPVQARNVLENGKSKNLWYEEVVPHQSVFQVVVICHTQEDDLYKFIQENKGIVQFGADASIGYGLCKVTEWKGASHE